MSDEPDANGLAGPSSSPLTHENHFVPRSDDEEMLWKVVEITAERGKKYKVKWEGNDPATGKPWAQSWVAKEDCTDDLVVDWKLKKKRKRRTKERDSGKKVGSTGHAGTASERASTSSKSKRTGSAATTTTTTTATVTAKVKRTRSRLTSEAASSRLESIERPGSPSLSPPLPLPPSKSGLGTKRKRRSESPVVEKKTPKTPMTTKPRAVVHLSERRKKQKVEEEEEEEEEEEKQEEEEEEEELRPSKKRKTELEETLLPPLSTDEEEEEQPLVLSVPRNEVPLKKRTTSWEDMSDDEMPRPPSKVKATGKQTAEAANWIRSKVQIKDTSRRKDHVVDTDTSEDEDFPPPSTFKNGSSLTRKLPQRRMDNLPEQEAEAPVLSMKVGPPRGIKRRGVSNQSGSHGKRGPPRTKLPKKDVSVDERVPKAPSRNEVPSPKIEHQDMVEDFVSTSPMNVSTPPVLPNRPPRSPILSPGAIARLDLFDRLMVEVPPSDAPPAADVPGHVPDDNYEPYESFDPPPPSPPLPPPQSKRSKMGMPNGLVVPESESSGNSQSQSQPLHKPPLPPPPPARGQSPGKPTEPVSPIVPPSSFVSPKDLVISLPKSPSPVDQLLKKPTVMKPIPQITPNTFRSTIQVQSQIADGDGPPSSIESFASPKRVEKGKQRAIDDDGFQSCLSEEEVNAGGVRTQITDSGLKKRGQELFKQAQRTRQKVKKTKRLEPINEIVNGTISHSSPSEELPRPVAGNGAETTLEMQWEEVVDFGANSATLDTLEHSEARSLSRTEYERLRIALRQEEEESTQEAMGIYPPAPMETALPDGDDNQMPPPELPKDPIKRHAEEVDHIEQPSTTELHQASVIVQPSQGQRQDDVDTELSMAHPPASSPPRRIPEGLTDSPKRRLGEALSVLHVKSEEIQRLERELASARKELGGLKAELAEARQPPEPQTDPALLAAWEAERARWVQERSQLRNEASEWQAKLKDIAAEKERLLGHVTELTDAVVRTEEAKLSTSNAEGIAWKEERDKMLADLRTHSEELTVLTQVREEYDRERAKWDAEKAEWVEEKVKLESERMTLQEKQETLSHSVETQAVSIESLTSAKLSAEKDRDFFREQYMQASGFVSSVREENEELEKRTKIAEGQAQEGVAAIKAMFVGRVEALRADIDRWKGLAELLQEKDKRTNDDLRQRAALVPELGSLCGRLAGEKKSLETELRKLGRAQQRGVTQRNKLYYQILVLRKERASLQSKLSRLIKVTAESNDGGDSSRDGPVGIQRTTSSQPELPPPSPPATTTSALVTPVLAELSPPASPPALNDPESIDPNDMGTFPDDPTSTQPSDISIDEPALFPCMWRPQWRDQCQQIFDTKEDLERHVQAHFHDLVMT